MTKETVEKQIYELNELEEVLAYLRNESYKNRKEIKEIINKLIVEGLTNQEHGKI